MPSTSKKVVCTAPNGAIGVVVPDCTKLKSNSAARSVVGVPSAHLAVAASSAAPEAQVDVRTPRPKHAKPAGVSAAWRTDPDDGLWYPTATLSA